MLLLREAFKRATTVYAYILTEGKKATAEIEMTLPEQEATEISTAVSEAIAQNMGAKEDLTGCTLNYDEGSRKLTMTLTGPVTEVKNTGLFDTVTALMGQGYAITIDGVKITGAADFLTTETYKKLAALEQGGADVLSTWLSARTTRRRFLRLTSHTRRAQRPQRQTPVAPTPSPQLPSTAAAEAMR